jgi:putative membrane protein
VAHQRLRGAEVVEGLLLRAGRGGQARALTTGLSREALGGAILPPAPLAEAHRVAAAALAEPAEEVTSAGLERHPRAALRRRLSRALIPAVALVGIAFWLADRVPVLFWLWPGALVALPIALALALDRYRNLGHALTERYLVGRHGSLLRQTAALQRDGVIGWRVVQSPFQRRAGVVTLEAVTAAGRGGYELIDVAPDRATELMAATTPDAVVALLDARPADRPPASGVGAGSRTSPG